MALDPQSAFLFGQQSSQGGGGFAEPKMQDTNENLAYYLAMLGAQQGGAQNPFGVSSGAPDVNSLGMSGGSIPQVTSPSTFETALGGLQTGLGAINTGTQLYGLGSKLYNALFSSPSLAGTIPAYDAASDVMTAAGSDLGQFGWAIQDAGNAATTVDPGWLDAMNWGW